jgi:DNA (cytosine-5)-methyltransferase 1
LLDLFSGAGGAGEGYRRAGFTVTGVDIEPHVYPPGDFIEADAMEVLNDTGFLAQFDAIHASPPCQRYSTMTAAHAKDNHPDLIAPVRAALHAWGGPYVIENVDGAKRELHDPFKLCGSSFGLRVRRHRWFESNAYITPLPCEHARQGTPVGVYGDHPEPKQHFRPGTGTSRAIKATSVEDARDALGIDWMNWLDLAESIPPAFTDWIGGQLADHIRSAAA